MQPLIFNSDVARQKPSNADKCPFCHREELATILSETSDMLWIENKYQTLSSAYQTLIIETLCHKEHMLTYSVDKIVSVLSFLSLCWDRLIASGDYQSVVAFKNYGPLSGGSLEHSHLQIVGFREQDAYERLSLSAFEGMEIADSADISVTLSTSPLMGSVEFNVREKSEGSQYALASELKKVLTYILTDYARGQCESYNIFFYRIEEEMICKVIPRFVASPYFIGYGLPFLAEEKRLEEIKKAYQTSKRLL